MPFVGCWFVDFHLELIEPVQWNFPITRPSFVIGYVFERYPEPGSINRYIAMKLRRFTIDLAHDDVQAGPVFLVVLIRHGRIRAHVDMTVNVTDQDLMRWQDWDFVFNFHWVMSGMER